MSIHPIGSETSDDDSSNLPISMCNKDELISKVKLLKERNKELRSTIARQRTLLDTYEGIIFIVILY